jgi:cytochrome P450
MTQDATTADTAAIPVVGYDELLADPHGLFRRMRPETPVIRTDPRRVSVLRAADVGALMTDPRTIQIPGTAFVSVMGIPEGRASAFLSSFFLLSNGEDHARKRGAFARTFAHPVIRAMRPDIRATADRIMADMPRGPVFDFIPAVAARVPAEMIADILGLPRSDAARFAAMVYAVSRTLSPPYAIDAHPEIEAAAEALFAYVSAALDDRRASPRDDLLSRLVADDNARALGDEELVYQVMGIILAGSDTTRAAFAILVALLLQHPDQWAAVKADPALIAPAINESLRFEPSIGTVPRLAARPVMLGGTNIEAGQMMALSTMSIQRDPAVYADPDRFDIRRTDNPRLHPVFGGGAHRCLGEMLARIELEEALAALVAAAPDIELVEVPRVIGFGGIRRVTPMMVRIPG